MFDLQVLKSDTWNDDQSMVGIGIQWYDLWIIRRGLTFVSNHGQ